MSQETVDSLEAQLLSLYEERDNLQQRLGVSSQDEIVGMVKNLEGQLVDLYSRFGSMQNSTPEVAQVVSQLNDLSNSLDGMFSEKSVVFEMQDDRPVLRAVWKQTLTEGDNR